MRSKHKLFIIIMLIGLLTLSLTLASCDLLNWHTHNYVGEWRADNTQHWKKCAQCNKVGQRAAHEVDEWIVDTPSTATQAGSRHGTCSVCSRLVTEEIPSSGCNHNFGGEYETNDDGHFKRCSICGEADITAPHDVAAWTQTKEPTVTENGSASGVCSVCDAAVTKVIPSLSHKHNYADTAWKSDNDNHWNECECGEKSEAQPHVKEWIIDTPATTTATGSKHEECSVCKRIFATETIAKIPTGTRTVDFYAINDFHGEVDKISATGGFLKGNKNTNANTILINSGDMFQGSMESNSNYGKLLSDSMSQIGFDAFAFGNHEFDWGLDNLRKLASESTVPFLGANIYKWNANTKSWGDFADDLAEKYVVKTLDNGLKVGIIGVIGQDQITSISSNLVQTIGFKDPLPIIKTLSEELRSKEGCDLVVVSAHAGPQGLVGEKEDNEQPSSAGGLESYVDAVFCAHTHRQQVYVVDGLPFIQGGSNGEYVSYVQLSVTNGKVTCTEQKNIAYSKSWDNLVAIDTLIDNANEKIKDERNQVLATLSGSMSKNPDIARLVSRAIAEYAKNQGYDICLAMVNTARSSLSSGTLTYSKLYEAIPFDNEVFIAKVKGSDILREVNYNNQYGNYSGNYYWRSSGEAIESNKYYYIAVIDYILYHQNANRTYNYFPSAFTSGFEPVALTKNGAIYNYRMITRDYLLANPNVNVSDYKSSNNTNIDTSILEQSVTLKYETVGTWSYLSDNVMGGDSGDNSNTSGGTTGNTGGTTDRHAGTLSDPYTVADALALAAGSTSSSDGVSGYVTGKITSGYYEPRRGSSSDDIGRIYLEDDDGNVIYVYWLKMFQGATLGNNWDWTGCDDNGSLPNNLKIGDTVVLFANSIYTYESAYSGTPQISSGYCVTVNGEATA